MWRLVFMLLAKLQRLAMISTVQGRHCGLHLCKSAVSGAHVRLIPEKNMKPGLKYGLEMTR